MRNLLKALWIGIAGFLAALAAIAAAKHQAKAKEWHSGSDEEVMNDIVSGTREARERAMRAKVHLDAAKKKRSTVMTNLNRQGNTNEEFDDALHRFRSHRDRGMHNDGGAS